MTLWKLELTAKHASMQLKKLRAGCGARGGGGLMPALPLDEAGKYVAGAYVVFLALILVYVAIIGAKLARIDRELTELAEERTSDRRAAGAGRLAQDRAAALREKLALPAGPGRAGARRADRARGVHEAVALFTCNRTELYLVTDDAVEAENATLAILSRQAGLRPTELLGSLYSLRGREAVEHLFSVTAGLDSMIVGEAEIQGQVKRAYEMALVEGVSGPVSNRLFRDALAAGKRVRSETGIARSQRLDLHGRRVSWRPTSWASWPTGACS